MQHKMVSKKKAKGKSFSKLTKAEQRVAIARDVLSQLAANKLIAEGGAYLQHDLHGFNKVDNKTELRDRLNEGTCTACAIGSVFVCAVRVFDKLTVGEATGRTGNISTIHPNKMVKYLEKFFSARQLCIMEGAFEGTYIGTHTRIGRAEERHWRDSANAAGDGYNDVRNNYDTSESQDTEMLKIVMRNVIRNNGTFVIPRDAVRKFKQDNERDLKYVS